MTNSFIVFCTARTEIVSRAVRAILKEPTDQTVVYTGPSDSPFAIAADRFISWGSGPFNIWKAVTFCGLARLAAFFKEIQY